MGWLKSIDWYYSYKISDMSIYFISQTSEPWIRVLQTLFISISLKTKFQILFLEFAGAIHSVFRSLIPLPPGTLDVTLHICLSSSFSIWWFFISFLPFGCYYHLGLPHLSQLPSYAPSYHHYIRLVSQQLFVSLDAAVPEDLSAVSLSTFRRCASWRLQIHGQYRCFWTVANYFSPKNISAFANVVNILI